LWTSGWWSASKLTGTGNFRGYFTLLRFQASGEELQQLTNLMTVNETYFLREEYQFRVPGRFHPSGDRPAQNQLGPDPHLVHSHRLPARSPIRSPCTCWKCGAAFRSGMWRSSRRTSIPAFCAVHGRPLFGPLRAERIHLRRGCRNTSNETGEEYQLCDDLRQAVEFTRVNLSEPADTLTIATSTCLLPEPADLFRRRIPHRRLPRPFTKRSIRAGFICLGHSESMSRISSLFKVRKFPEAIVYQKGMESSK
jgi:chemotaxis protein methyltransferase CheR